MTVTQRLDPTSRWILALLLLVCVVSSPWLVHPWYEATIDTNDGSIYILSAQALLRGEGYGYLGQPIIIRPPAMSVLIAPILAWRGLDFLSLNLIAHGFGILGTLLFFLWVRPRTGPWVAGAAALVLWFNPGWRHFSNQVMSDVPGAALFVGALLLERWAAAQPGWKRDALLGAFIGLSTYMRTVSVLIVPAILAARACEALARDGRSTRWFAFLRERGLALTAGCVLVMLPWSVRNSVQAPPPPAMQNYFYSYGTAMFHSNPRDPSSPLRPISRITDEIPNRIGLILGVLGSRFEGRAAPLPAPLIGVWIVAAFAVVAWKRRGTAEFTFLLIGSLLLVYFGFQTRLVLPMFIVGLATFAEAHVLLLSRWVAPARAGVVVAVALVGIACVDFQPRKGWDEIKRHHGEAIEQAKAWNAVLGDRTRLASRVGWHHSLYLGKPVWSLRFASKQAAVDDTRPPDNEAIANLIAAQQTQAVVLSSEPADRAWIPKLERLYGQPVTAGTGTVFLIH